MSSIVMATSQPDQWRDFIQVLEDKSGVPTGVVATGDEVLQSARGKNLLAVILTQDVEVMTGVELVHRLIAINAMIHVAWASALTKKEFHEVTEGLGILMKLSPTPDVEEASCLAERLGKMSGAI